MSEVPIMAFKATPPMDPEIKERWVNALLSEKFSQGYGYLRVDEGHCCLGVLCEVAIEDGVTERMDSAMGVPGYKETWTPLDEGESKVHAQIATLPIQVMEWAGLKEHSSPVIIQDGRSVSLASLNDSGRPFKEIASYIEEYL